MAPRKNGEMSKISNQSPMDLRTLILFLSIQCWLCVAQFLIMRDGDDESITTVNITTVHGSNDSLESRSLPFNVQSFPPERLVQRSSSVTFSKQKLTSFLSSPPRLELSFSWFVSCLHLCYGEPVISVESGLTFHDVCIYQFQPMGGIEYRFQINLSISDQRIWNPSITHLY